MSEISVFNTLRPHQSGPYQLLSILKLYPTNLYPNLFEHLLYDFHIWVMLQQEGETPQVNQGELSGQLDSCGEHVGPDGFGDESRLTLMDRLYSLKMAR